MAFGGLHLTEERIEPRTLGYGAQDAAHLNTDPLHRSM